MLANCPPLRQPGARGPGGAHGLIGEDSSSSSICRGSHSTELSTCTVRLGFLSFQPKSAVLLMPMLLKPYYQTSHSLSSPSPMAPRLLSPAEGNMTTPAPALAPAISPRGGRTATLGPEGEQTIGRWELWGGAETPAATAAARASVATVATSWENQWTAHSNGAGTAKDPTW
jgi:hypothetical protein